MSDGPGSGSPTGTRSTLADDAPGSAPPGPSRWRRLPPYLRVGVPLLVVALVAAVVFVVRDDGPPPRVLDRPPGPTGGWTSGASGEGVIDGAFGEWRGRPLGIAATWADEDPDLQTELPQLHRGEEFGDWQRDLDIAIGAIGDDETWAEAADGDFDRRWRQSLRNLRRLWGDRPGTLYIRFAHEMNGDWYPWAVDADNHQDFIAAWRRFRELQQEIFPESQLVFCVNRESVESGIDWRETFPGADHVDVLAVDYYNQYPYVETLEEFEETATEMDDYGGPKGIRAHLAFAREQGLPLAVPEWGGNATEGDAPAFIYGMHRVFAEEGGTGPGEILYEIVFNVAGYDDAFQMYPDTAMPASAEQYRRLW